MYKFVIDQINRPLLYIMKLVKNNTLTNYSKRKKSNDKNELNDIIMIKLNEIQEIIRNTVISISRNKVDGVFSNNDSVLSTSVLTDLYEKTKKIDIELSTKSYTTIDEIINSLQGVIDKVSMVICGFGTSNINDLLFISFGSEFKNVQVSDPILRSKQELIKKYIRPVGYKIIHWKNSKASHTHSDILCQDKISENDLKLEDYNTFECFNVENDDHSFYQKVYGIRVLIQNEKARKTLVISGIIEDIHIDCFTNEYINSRVQDLLNVTNGRPPTEKNLIKRIVETMTFKDILIDGNNDIIKKVIIILTDVKSIKHNKLENTISKFIESDTFTQRNMLINLLLFDKDSDIQYISYLLYEILSVDSSDNDNNDQHKIYNSLPWKIKSNFKEVIKDTIRCANERMMKYDINQITLEQQIYLMKADDKVKEKAMLKLKEIKGRPDEMGLKGKQYIEGLLKIPFNIYREEPSLKQIKEMNKWFIRILSTIKLIFPNIVIFEKPQYTLFDITQNISELHKHIRNNMVTTMKNLFDNFNIKQINIIVQKINSYKKTHKEPRLMIANQTKLIQTKKIYDFMNNLLDADPLILYELFDMTLNDSSLSLVSVKTETRLLSLNTGKVHQSIQNIMNVLDSSIYAHTHAKNQIMKIIGQWMNGEQTGYCFGFEGNPGIGKTSLAKKGLSMCLTNDENEPRPFSFIALGGSSNGSSLEGHSYTYMNSTWGKIVEILMESKCMNPIIYVDELDKVSKTETGRELIGIFTHLIDQTQNDSFQDKYFTGIDLDLSKALFIFSYNDPEQVDKILLDRIHRIKFENLTLDEKLEIVKRFILPEINKKMGFTNVVEISDIMIEHIIETYTIEPGVRKLKELLFDLFGEINLDILKNTNSNMALPIKITQLELEEKYLTKYVKINEKKIHNAPIIGTINGLWANSLGRGGIIPIQTMLYPSSIFLDLRLTGLQGDVMKESMNVAKSLAWNLTPKSKKKDLIAEFAETKCQGLHIHCPEGAISKDGPSAGTAITVAIYSLFNNKKISNTIAITGEINLQGEITEIGGLSMKLSGGIKSGIKTFLYPTNNENDYLKWKSTAKPDLYKDITFHSVNDIHDVFDIVFE